MTRLIAAGLILRGVVDQMDSGVAAIEWPTEEISYLPISALPANTVEGDAIVFRIRPAQTLRRAHRETSTAARVRGRQQPASKPGHRREK